MKRYKVVMVAEVDIDAERFDNEWANGFDICTFLGLGLFDKDGEILVPKVDGIFSVVEYDEEESSVTEI